MAAAAEAGDADEGGAEDGHKEKHLFGVGSRCRKALAESCGTNRSSRRIEKGASAPNGFVYARCVIRQFYGGVGRMDESRSQMAQ